MTQKLQWDYTVKVGESSWERPRKPLNVWVLWSPTIKDSHVGEAAVSIGNAVWTTCRLNVSQTPVLSGPQGAMLADTVELLREATLWEVFRSLGHVIEGDCGTMGASFASWPQDEWLYSVTSWSAATSQNNGFRQPRTWTFKTIPK